MATEIITRAEARALGLKRYFTGQACKNGHIAERYVSSQMCAECCIEILRNRYRESPERERARAKSWRDAHIDEARAREAKYRKENPEERRAAEKRWRDANPEKVKEMDRRARRIAAEKHPERLAASRAKWMAVPENREARKASIKAWRDANPERTRAITRNRRAKIAAATGTHTAADVAEILTAQGHRCAYCRANLKRTKKHVDHIQPLALGGSNGRANLQVLCAPCNQSKSARDPIDYAQSLGLLI